VQSVIHLAGGGGSGSGRRRFAGSVIAG